MSSDNPLNNSDSKTESANDASLLCTSQDACPYEADILKLKAEIKQLSELVNTDILTGLYNYRHFLTAISQEMERSQRTSQPTALIMLDADHFKRVNDTWGHEVGNQALKHIARAITNNIRKLDIACRYGGEEFAIILPSTELQTAKQVSERVRKCIENSAVEVEISGRKQGIHLTVSIGFSLYFGDISDSANQLIERADQQLYKAKQSGRNQVCYDEQEPGNHQVDDSEKSALFDIFSNRDD